MSNVDDLVFGATLSRIRHELRTPAGHIIGYAEMMEEDLDEADASDDGGRKKKKRKKKKFQVRCTNTL